jgi:hypothetical protein
MIICSTSNIDLIHGQDEEGYGKIDGITDWRITNIPSITPEQTGIFSIFNSVTPTIPNISILETGTVGIGTIPSISSAAKMEIVGSVNITGSYNINNRNAINDTSNYVLSSSNAIVARINAFGSEGYFTVSNNATSNTILSISNNFTPVIGTPSIELIRGTSGDTNIDYKIGNYNGDFKVMSSISNTDTERFAITSSGNFNINSTSLSIINMVSGASNYTSNVVSIIGEPYIITFADSNVPTTHSIVTDTPTDRYMIFTTATVNHTFTVPVGGIKCDILMIGGGGFGGRYSGGGAGACIIAMNQTLPAGSCIVNVGDGAQFYTETNGADSYISVGGTVRYRAKGGGFSSDSLNRAGYPGGCGGGAGRNTDSIGELGGQTVDTNVVVDSNGTIITTAPTITSSYAVLGNPGGDSSTSISNGSGGGIGAPGETASGTVIGKGGDGAYQVLLTGSSTPINFRNYFANGSTSFGDKNGTTDDYYIGGGGAAFLSTGGWRAVGLGNSVGGGGYSGTGAKKGMVIIRYRSTPTITTLTNINKPPVLDPPYIGLIRSISGYPNIDYKIGNYNGDFKVMSSISNADTDRMIIKSSGNVGIGTTNPANELHLFDNLTNNTSLIIQNNSITVTGSSAPVINPTNVSGGTFSVGQITGSIDRFMIFTAGTSSFTVPAGGMNCDILMIGSGGSSANGGSGAGACIVAINQTFPDGACTVVVGASVGGSTQVNGQDSSISVAGTTRYLAKGGGFVSGTANTKGGDGGCGGGASSWNSGGAASGGQAVSTNIVNAIPNIGPTITSTYAVLGNVGGGNGGVSGAAGGGGGIEPNVSSGAGSSGASGGKGGDGAYQVTLSGASTPINFRTYFANNGTFGVQNGTTGNYYIGGGGGGLGAGGSQGNGGLGGGGGVNNAGVVNTGAGGATGGASGSGIVIIRYRVNQTALGNSSIELIRGISSDTNADYKIGNYNGDFKIMSSVSNTDTERIIINSTGNVGIGTTNPANELHLFDNLTNNTSLIIQNNFTSSYSSNYTKIVPTFVASFTGVGNNVPSTHSAVTATPTDRFMIFTAANVNHTFTVPTDGLSCDILMIGGGGAGGGGGGYYGGGGAGACIVAMNQTLPSGVCIVNVGTGGTSSINGGDSFIKVDNIDRYRAKGGGFSSTVDNVTGTAGGCGGGASYNTDTTTESGGIAVSTNVVNGSTATIGPSITSSYAVMGNMGGSNGTEQGKTGSGGGIGTAGVIAGKGGNGAYEVTLLGASTPINFRNYFANGSTSFGVQDGISTNYYIGGGGGGYGGNYFAGGLGGAGSFSNSYTSVANTGSGGTGGGAGASGIIIIRYRTETILTSTTITTLGTPSIELIRGTSGDTNADYKIGNYNGDFKIMSSISNTDTDQIIINSTTGNVGIGTTNPTSKLQVNGSINGTFVGNGSGITGLTTSQISGLDTALTTALTSKQNTINSTAGQIIIGNGNGVTTTSTALTFSGTTLTATNFSGNGSGITSLNAGNISGGTLAVARGGTGRTSFDANQILVGSLTQSGNLTWDGSSLYVNGYVRPSAGNGNNGIIFPTDPGGGNGDVAFIKYYARTGEGCTLEISSMNDADDHILLSASGGVGIGVIPATKFHVAGEIFATGNITAYYSDERLKTKISNIKDPLEIINKLNGFYYTPNDLARINGITNCEREIGLSAQEVQKVLPEIVKIAPFDSERNKDGVIVSKSGENYLTMSYERLTPVFVEAIKELERKNIELTREIALIKEKLK